MTDIADYVQVQKYVGNGGVVHRANGVIGDGDWADCATPPEVRKRIKDLGLAASGWEYISIRGTEYRY